jgi:hypothetical protein
LDFFGGVRRFVCCVSKPCYPLSARPNLEAASWVWLCLNSARSWGLPAPKAVASILPVCLSPIPWALWGWRFFLPEE